MNNKPLDRRFFGAMIALCLGYVAIVSQLSTLGGAILCLGSLAGILLLHKEQKAYGLLVWLAVVIMAIIPVATTINVSQFIFMGGGMIVAVATPYIIAHRRYKTSFLDTAWDLRKRWTRREVAYVLTAVMICGFWLFYYFLTTNANKGWSMESTNDILIVFAVIMIIGLWEELFFIAFIFTALNRYLPFLAANTLQAIMFTAFLYQIGFQGWIVPFVFSYTWYQGYVFYKTKNLLVTITIHVLVDLLVFVALLFSVRPDLF